MTVRIEVRKSINPLTKVHTIKNKFKRKKNSSTKPNLKLISGSAYKLASDQIKSSPLKDHLMFDSTIIDYVVINNIDYDIDKIKIIKRPNSKKIYIAVVRTVNSPNVPNETEPLPKPRKNTPTKSPKSQKRK